MNKQILLGLLSIFAVVALVGGTTFALFQSNASNNGNTFGAGTLVLNIKDAPGSTSTPLFTVTKAMPGDSFTQVIKLSNTGNIAIRNGSLILTKIDLTPTPASPDLGGKLNLELWKDNNNNGIIEPGAGGDTLIGAIQPLTNSLWTGLDLGFGLSAFGEAGASQNVIAKITFDTSADSTYQSASDTFNFNFTSEQVPGTAH